MSTLNEACLISVHQIWKQCGSIRFAMTSAASLQSTLSSVIGRQFDSSNSEPSSFGIKVMTPIRWEMASSSALYAALKLATKSTPNRSIKNL